MADSFEIHDPISPAARTFFTSHETSLIPIYPERKLQDYELLCLGKPVLTVSDFTVLLIDTDEIDLADLGVLPRSISQA